MAECPVINKLLNTCLPPYSPELNPDELVWNYLKNYHRGRIPPGCKKMSNNGQLRSRNRIYGKRWDIEVFFKMIKHYLNLEWETQLRDFDGIIGHITIVMSRYIFLAFEQRCHADPRTLGSLFYACSEEQQDLGLVEAMRRLLSLALDKVRAADVTAERAVLAIVDALMGFAVDMLQTGKRLAHFTNIITAS